MGRAKKKLETALKKTDGLPDSWFGDVEASIQELPSIQGKRERVRKNIYIDKKTAEVLEIISEKNGVSFTDIANDILTRFVTKGKKQDPRAYKAFQERNYLDVFW